MRQTKPILSIVFLVLIGQLVFGQDIIVTTENDTIRCEVAKEDEGFYYFTFYDKSGANTTLISKENVKLVKLDFEDYPALTRATKEPKAIEKTIRHQDLSSEFQNEINRAPNKKAFEQRPEVVSKKDEWSRVRIAIGGGYGRTLTGIPEGLGEGFDDYYRKLRSGPVFNSSISWYYQEAIGLKLGFGYYRVHNEANLVLYNLDGSETTGILRDDIRYSTLGLSLNWRRIGRNSKGIFEMSSGVAYLNYLDRGAYFSRFEAKANTAVFISEMSYDYKLSDGFAIGAALSLTVGALSQFEYDDGFSQQTITLPAGTYESLTHIDFTIGMRFLQ